MVDFFNPAARGGLNPLDAFNIAQESARLGQVRDLTQKAQQGGLGSEAFGKLAGFDPTSATKLKSLLKTDDQGLDAAFQDAAVFRSQLQSDPTGQRGIQFLQNRVQAGESQGRDMFLTKGLLETALQDPTAALKEVNSFLDIPGQLAAQKTTKSAGTREFEELTKGLSPEEKTSAKLVKLGLSPRAVGSALQTISDKGIADQIGKTSAIIKQREKFGELSGTSRAKAIDQGIEKIAKINLGLGNIDRAIIALNQGAGVGAIERFLPSFKAASVALDNIQKSMALDVIGAVTFGALSEGELNLAKEVALPTGLDTPELIKHLQDRKAAQEKLRSYFNEQIQFLDQGGTVAGFLRKKERDQEGHPQSGAQASQAQVSPVSPSTIGRFTVEVQE